ncbi:UNVERIFIED_CONTAM: hypothetical protein Sradi_7060200 [Sesamum radiatum]|uniref:Uncharacterized protein n=1 Tax=Sesamum radiatum TaxID=300843 RepID=A0AAW2J7P4_SESRA
MPRPYEPCHRKVRILLSIALIIDFGNKKTEDQYTCNEPITDFRSWTRPAMEKEWCAQPANLLSSLWRRGLQSSIVSREATNGTPRYLMGSLPS